MNYQIIQYLEKLGVEDSKGNANNLLKQLKNIYNNKKAEKIFQGFFRIRDDDMKRKYEYKNKDFERSMIFSGAFEYGYYVGVGKWLEQNKNLFGKNILDVGCDNGIMSCFLATLLPDSKITSIDLNKCSIEIANELKEKLNLNNIEFQVSDLSNITNQKYDTVLEMAILHENINTSLSPTNFMYLDDQIEHWKKETQKLAEDSVRPLEKEGTFISILRSEQNQMFIAWLQNLSELGMEFPIGNINEIPIQEGVVRNEFQFIVSKLSSKPNFEETYNWWLQSAYNKTEVPECTGYLSDIKLYVCAKDIITGYRYYDKNNDIVAEYALFSSKVDYTAVYLMLKSYIHDKYFVQTYDFSKQEELYAEVENMKTVFEGHKYRSEKITYE